MAMSSESVTGRSHETHAKHVQHVVISIELSGQLYRRVGEGESCAIGRGEEEVRRGRLLTSLLSLYNLSVCVCVCVCVYEVVCGSAECR